MRKSKLSKVNLTPVTDNLKQDYLYVDNEIQSSLTKLKFFASSPELVGSVLCV